MRSERSAPRTRARTWLTGGALCAALLGCVDAGVVLQRELGDGAVPLDQGAARDSGVDSTAPPADGGSAGNVTIYLTGFDAYAGMTIRARLGALSAVLASAVIAPDGTAVIILNQIFTILSSTYFESYIDLDGSGTCSGLVDRLAAANVLLTPDGDNYRVDLDESDTSSPLVGCLVLN